VRINEAPTRTAVFCAMVNDLVSHMFDHVIHTGQLLNQFKLLSDG
jgi:hypothetical protein